MPQLTPINHVSVRTHLNDLPGFSGAALVLCNDGQKYVIKRASLGRPLVAEQIVGRLGERLGAPCMKVALAGIPPELVSADPKLGRFDGGPAHATAFVDGVIELRHVAHQDLPPNRTRFAALLVLYSVARAHDYQFMYTIVPPPLVYSHDHGHFFPGSCHWNAASCAAEHAAAFDVALSAHNFTSDEMRPAIEELRSTTDHEIAEIVTGVPPEWGVLSDDLQALSACLVARKNAVVKLFDAL